MGEGTAKKSFKVLDRNSDDWYVFFFTFIWQMVRLHFGQAVYGMMISNVCGKNKYLSNAMSYIDYHSLVHG